MRSRAISGISLLFALVALLGFPWLAWQESRRQAFDSVAELTNAYARAVLHRTSKAALQADAAMKLLDGRKDAPCSPDSLTLMRHLDLTSTYIQAVGFVRDETVVCSSMGGAPFKLGSRSLRSSNGVALYLNVPLALGGESPLMALERDDFAVLVHRELPLDIATSVPGVALAVLHLEAKPGSAPELSRGTVDRAWLAFAPKSQEVAFTSGHRLVAVVRSPQFRIAAVAAVPIAYLNDRTHAIARRLVPAGVLAGLAVTIALLSLVRRQRSMASSLRYALQKHEFYLQYQPIIELASGRCVGVEALLRWKRPSGEMIGPDLFIPVAEQTGIMPRLTERVLKLAEADAGSYLASHPGFHVALNLSPADLQSGAIVDGVDRFLKRSGASPSNLILEITERGFLDMDTALRTIAALRARGIEIAIDDFGTGYSSLSYLETLELDFLKIDRSFIDTIGTRAPTSQVVGHIIAMARTLKLRIIAEGIETQAQADFLIEHGVEYGQGWLYGKPMPFSEAVRFAESLGAGTPRSSVAA